MAASVERGRRLLPDTAVPTTRRTAAGAIGALLVVELLAVAVYLRVTDTGVLAPRYTLYPFVWINVAAWVLLRRPRVTASTGRRVAAAGLSVQYFLLLAYAGGLLGVGGPGLDPGVRVAWLSPGWGPVLIYAGDAVTVSLVPFETVGYAALAVLVYTVLLTGARSAFASVLGLAACVGCLWPLGAAALAAIGGLASPLATVVPGLAYDVSTALFVLTAGVLHWAARRTA